MVSIFASIIVPQGYTLTIQRTCVLPDLVYYQDSEQISIKEVTTRGRSFKNLNTPSIFDEEH